MREGIRNRSKAVLDVIEPFSAVAPHTEWHFPCPETKIPPRIVRPDPARGGLRNNEHGEAAGIGNGRPEPATAVETRGFSKI
jgi:hypothetical protein